MTDFRLVQSIYGLLLGVWLGAMVMLGLGATAAFGFVRGIDGVLLVSLNGWSDPLVDSNAEGFLAGGVVGAMLGKLAWLQLICAAGLALCVAAQFVWYRAGLIGGAGAKRQGVRVFFIAVPALIVLFNLFVVTPGIEQWREPKYDLSTPADEHELAEQQFALYHGLSTKTYGVATLMIAGALLMTPWCLRDPEPDDTPGPDPTPGPPAT